MPGEAVVERKRVIPGRELPAEKINKPLQLRHEALVRWKTLVSMEKSMSASSRDHHRPLRRKESPVRRSRLG